MKLKKLILDYGGPKAARFFYPDAKLIKQSKEEIRNYLSLYLEEPYDNSARYVINLLNICIKKEAFLPSELDTLLVESLYFNSMPEEDAYKFLKNVGFCLRISPSKLPKFIASCTRKIHNLNELIDLINNSSAVNLEVAKSTIVAVSDIETLISCENAISYRSDKIGLGSEMVKSGIYNLEDFKRYCEGTDASVSYIVDWLADYYYSFESYHEKNQALDYLIDFANIEEEFPKEEDALIDVRTKKTYKGYAYYAYIISNNSKYTPELIKIILKKIKRRKNYKFMCACLAFIDHDMNFELINALVSYNNDVILRMLSLINNKYLEYAIETLIQNYPHKVEAIISELCANAKYFPTNRLDRILDILYKNNPDFQISIENSLALIFSGSKYTNFFFYNYDYNASERARILQYYSDNHCDDSLALYKNYLCSGDKSQLLITSTINRNAANPRRIRVTDQNPDSNM